MRVSLAPLLIAFTLPHLSAAPAAPARPEQRAAQSILRSLKLRDRIAQMVVGVVYGNAPSRASSEYEKYRHWVQDLRIGGLIVNNRVQNGIVQNAEPHVMALFLNQMQRLARTPLIVGGDFERGASMRVSGTTRFPHGMAYAAARDAEATRREGLMTAREARAMGVHWVFAPVSDVNNNPDNPVINIRSFGENPQEVAAHVSAYIQGAHSDPKNPVLVSAKHFPGHGDTSVDSHLDLARLDADRERIEAVELAPFRAAIASGVDSIMTAHITVPAIDPEEIPATVSRRVLTGLLREQLGFNGLVVTDAMDMQGLSKKISGGEAAVRSIEAGADVLLMPPDPEGAIQAVLAAVERGRLSRRRIDQSVQRLLEAKVRLGLMKKKLVDLDAISDALDSEEEAAEAQSIADRAVTLVRDTGNVVPLAAPDQACVVISAGLRLSTFGQRLNEEFRKRAPKARLMFVDNAMPGAVLDTILGDAAGCSVIVFATFTTNLALNGELTPFVRRLTEGATPVIFVSLGNPYLLKDFPGAAAHLAAFSPTVPAEIAVVKALFGEMPVTGRLPVTIPGLAALGGGVQVPRRGVR